MIQASHTTAHEVKFVREISSVPALRGYIAASNRRTNWDGMQADIILTAAHKRLEELLARKIRR